MTINDSHAIPAHDQPQHWYEVQGDFGHLAYGGTDRDTAIDQIVGILARTEQEPEIWASRLPEGWDKPGPHDHTGTAAPAEARAVFGAARLKLAEARQAALESELEQPARAMTATKTRESHHVDLDIADGPSMTDAFGDDHTITGIRISYADRQATAIRVKSASRDVFVENIEDPGTWPQWLRSLVDQYRNP